MAGADVETPAPDPPSLRTHVQPAVTCPRLPSYPDLPLHESSGRDCPIPGDVSTCLQPRPSTHASRRRARPYIKSIDAHTRTCETHPHRCGGRTRVNTYDRTYTVHVREREVNKDMHPRLLLRSCRQPAMRHQLRHGQRGRGHLTAASRGAQFPPLEERSPLPLTEGQ